MTSPASWADDPILAKVKRALVETHGVRAFADAAALFRSLDKNKSGFLEPEEFAAGIAACGVTLSAQEMRYLILAFDDDRSGHISLHEWVGELVYPQMNIRRQRVVIRAYNDLKSKAQGGTVTPAFCRQSFDVQLHPEVRAGRVPAYLIERELDLAFGDEIAGNEAGDDHAISLDTFKALLSGISAVVPSDDIFEEMIVLGFHIDRREQPHFADSARDWSHTKVGKDPLEYAPKRPDDAWSKSLQQMTLQNRKGYDQTVTQRPQPNREPVVPRTVPRTWETTSRVSFGGGVAAQKK